MFILIVFISLNFFIISNSGFNETFYKYLKNNSEFEIVDIDFKNTSNKRKMEKDIEDVLDEITIDDIITLSQVIYSLYSGNIDVNSIMKLTVRIIELTSDSLPKKYNFVEEKKIMYNFQYSQHKCEPSAGYAVALLASYRRYMATESYENSRFAAITIMEYYGRCNKFNLLDAFDYAHKIGLVTYQCRDEIYCSDCGPNICPTLENLYRETPKTEEPHKINEPYKIEGEENIKKEIYKNGPVITTYTLYDSIVYYKSGYIKEATGIKVGPHEAIIYGWDDQGWLAHSVFGFYWGDNGKFKVAYKNDIDFGKIAFAYTEKGESTKNFNAFLLIFIFCLLL